MVGIINHLKPIIMKKQLLKFSIVMAFLLAMSNVGFSQQSEIAINVETCEPECSTVERSAVSRPVVCSSWMKVRTDKRCLRYYQGFCICTEYWDVERRTCHLPGTSWHWEEFRNTNYRTTGNC